MALLLLNPCPFFPVPNLTHTPAHPTLSQLHTSSSIHCGQVQESGLHQGSEDDQAPLYEHGLFSQ